jgi:hypothetical protein
MVKPGLPSAAADGDLNGPIDPFHYHENVVVGFRGSVATRSGTEEYKMVKGYSAFVQQALETLNDMSVTLAYHGFSHSPGIITTRRLTCYAPYEPSI